MPQVIATIDVVGSTEAKERYGQAHAIKLIGAGVTLACNALRKADLSLIVPAPSAGDSILLVGGVDPVEIYHAAVVHQAMFRAWHYNRLPVKIALGWGHFETIDDGIGFPNHRGSDLDFLYRMCDWCPSAGVVVTPAFYGIVMDAGFGRRLHPVREKMKGLGTRTFYQSNGDFKVGPDMRQRRRRLSANFLDMVVVIVGASLTSAVVSYFLRHL